MFFSEPYFSAEQNRVYGYKDSKRLGVALYPGFTPIAQHTVNDLELVFGDSLEWTPEAHARRRYIARAAEAVKTSHMPDDFTSVLTPFEHQTEAIVKGYWEERMAIFHDCGLGKTKTMIDILRLLKKETTEPFGALIVCPSHLVRNWSREISKHTFPGELTVCAMADDNNSPPPPADRQQMYQGVRELNPPTGSRFIEAYPDVYYDPLPEGLPDEVYALEDAYVEGIAVDDAKARGSARSKLRRRAAKFGFDLPNAAKWKRLGPVPEATKVFDVLVVSYDVLSADEESIYEHFNYSIIAADESHYLRGYKSARTKATCRASQRAQRRYLLSGTPSLGDPMHVYGQLKYLSPVLIDGWFKYTRRYLIKSKFNKHMIVGFKNLHVLNDILNDISHRRKQEDCLDLPPLRIIEVPVDPDDATKHTYNEIVSAWGTSFTDPSGERRAVEVQQAPDRLNKLLQVLSGFYIDSNKDHELCEGCPFLMDCVGWGHRPYTEECMVHTQDPPKTTLRLNTQPRLDQAMGLLNDILQEETNKVIIWASYTEEINMVEERLEKLGVGYVRVDGRTRNKVACEDKFREDPKCRVYLSHISISEGLTLNAANYTLYYGLTYDLKDYVQSMKRNYRIGQERPVTVYHLVTPRSIQRYILDALAKKQDVANTMTDAIQCGTCEFYEKCQENGTQPFDEGCIYNPKQKRVIMRPALL